MLITEHTADGRTVVRLRKDWHPGRIGLAYVPPIKRYEMGRVEKSIQDWALQGKLRRKP
jgi:hypothetical protein